MVDLTSFDLTSFRFTSLIVANLLRNRRRTALTVASIAVSLCLLTVLGAMYRALFLQPDATPAQALRLITHHRISITQPMPVSFLARIRSVPGVHDSMIWQFFGGTYKDNRDPRNIFARFAVEPDRFFNIKVEIAMPDDEKQAFVHIRNSCIVGKAVADRLALRPGDHIAITGDIFPVNLDLIIAGIYSAPEDNQNLYFNYEYLRQLLMTSGQSSRADQVGVFFTQVDHPDDAEPVAAAIDKQFEDSPAPTKTESERAWQLSFVSFLGNLKLFVLSISAALTFTILLVSGNTVSMSVRERVREVGIFKTLGFTPEMILAIFLGESMVMAIAGGFAGLLLGAVLSFVVNMTMPSLGALNLGLTPGVAAFVLLVAAVIGVISSYIPARSASRLSILQSLGHVG